MSDKTKIGSQASADNGDKLLTHEAAVPPRKSFGEKKIGIIFRHLGRWRLMATSRDFLRGRFFAGLVRRFVCRC